MLEDNLPSNRTPSGVLVESQVSQCGCDGGRRNPRMRRFDQWSGGIFNQSLLDGLPLRIQKSVTDALRENLEEWNGVFNAFKIGGNFQPYVEAPPLVPSGDVFLEDG